MKKSTFLVAFSIILFSSQCSADKSKEENSNDTTSTSTPETEEPVASVKSMADLSIDEIQADPLLVMEFVFYIAKTKEFEKLSGICDPNGYSDTQSICTIATADVDQQEEFVLYFEKGTVNSFTFVNGNTANISILFGPNGSKSEVMKLVKIDDKWYLSSF
jgi:hypothetical protein